MQGRNTYEQCKSCPWRVDCDPEKDIPGYDRKLAENLHWVLAGHRTKPKRDVVSYAIVFPDERRSPG